jgi:hypothetical protein
MSDRQKLIKARMGMLALAEELNNISAACRRAGISRSHYYEIKDAFEKFGAGGLAPQPRRKPRMPNQTPPETESQILEMTEGYPTLQLPSHLGAVEAGRHRRFSRRRAGRLHRHDLTLRIQHLLWLEHKTAAAGGVLTDRQIRLLHKHRSRTADPEQQVEAPYPGYLLCQDTFFVGTIKGVGKIYMQSVVDAHCSLGFAKLYLSKVPMAAVDVLHDRVFPFLENYDADPEHILTDSGREFCGRELSTTTSCSWRFIRSSTAAPRSARRKPTVSANASIAPSKRIFSLRPSARLSTKASPNCRPTSTATSTSIIASAPIAVIAPKGGHPSRPFSTAWLCGLLKRRLRELLNPA